MHFLNFLISSCCALSILIEGPYGRAKLLCAVCKDAFPNPWDLIVHAQAAHMVNIYELGSETNGVVTTATAAAAAVTAAVAANNQDVEDSMMNELDEEELCVMHGRFMTTQANNITNTSNTSTTAATSITTATTSVTSTAMTLTTTTTSTTATTTTKRSTLTPSTSTVTTSVDILSSLSTLEPLADNILTDNVHINGITNGFGDCNNGSDSGMNLSYEVKLNGGHNSISITKEVRYVLSFS